MTTGAGGPNKKAAFFTLGCKVNQQETEALAGLFRQHGYDIVEFEDAADVYIINTCTVTHLADRKSRQLIRRAVKNNPRARVVVMGCYAQTSPEEVQKIPGVQLVVGTKEREQIIRWLEEVKDEEGPVCHVKDIRKNKDFEDISVDSLSGRARAYLKVQEGCEQFCSYCIIPYARGPLRSRPLENAVTEAQKLIAAGFKEIILTGIHLGAYGQDLGAGLNLVKLLTRLLPLEREVRWRLSSLEPTEVDEGLLSLLVKYDNFCAHLHLPLQSGHDDILRAMNRPYTTSRFKEIVSDIRRAVPEISITTDIMVGFPGETAEHFCSCLALVEELAFSKIHVFKYSPRRGTPAAQMANQVPPPVKEERSRELMALAERLAHHYALRFVGKTVEVLAEQQVPHLAQVAQDVLEPSEAQDVWEGHSANYLKVYFRSAEVTRGDIVPVHIKEVREQVAWGDPFIK